MQIQQEGSMAAAGKQSQWQSSDFFPFMQKGYKRHVCENCESKTDVWMEKKKVIE